MIVIGALCASAIAAAAGLWLGMRRKKVEPYASEPLQPSPVARVFSLAIGDVCIQAGYRKEFAVASRWMLRDDALRGALWLGTDKSTLLTTRDRRWWMTRVDSVAYVGADVPSTIELEGHVLHRRRRLPVQIECEGDERFGADAAILGEYEDGAGKVAVLLACSACAAAFIGNALRDDELEVWVPAADDASAGTKSA